MAEYFDLLSPTGEPLGITKERNAVHRDGDWHPSVHIFVIQGDPGTASTTKVGQRVFSRQAGSGLAPAMWTPARTT